MCLVWICGIKAKIWYLVELDTIVACVCLLLTGLLKHFSSVVLNSDYSSTWDNIITDRLHSKTRTTKGGRSLLTMLTDFRHLTSVLSLKF